MTRPGRYAIEIRERAVRLVLEHAGEYASQWAAITSIAAKCGMTAETLRKWVRRAEVDVGARPGLTTDERKRLAELERENRELRRANEILKTAAVHSTGQCNTITISGGVGWRSLAGRECRMNCGERSGSCGQRGSRLATSGVRSGIHRARSSRSSGRPAAMYPDRGDAVLAR
jgi:transposase